jgi:hypothetical protein
MMVVIENEWGFLYLSFCWLIVCYEMTTNHSPEANKTLQTQ